MTAAPIVWDERDESQEDGRRRHLKLEVTYDTSTHYARLRDATPEDLAAAGYGPLPEAGNFG